MIYLLLFTIALVHGLKFNKNYFNKFIKKITPLEEVISLVKQEKTCGYLSTLNYSNKLNGYPYSSLVNFISDYDGNIIFCLSDISQHTKNINKNSAVSLLIPQKRLYNQNQKRVTLTGNIEKVYDEYEKEYLRDIYLKSNNNAYWLKHLDFNIYKMSNIKDIYYVGGFSKATKINVKRYFEDFKNI